MSSPPASATIASDIIGTCFNLSVPRLRRKELRTPDQTLELSFGSGHRYHPLLRVRSFVAAWGFGQVPTWCPGP